MCNLENQNENFTLLSVERIPEAPGDHYIFGVSKNTSSGITNTNALAPLVSCISFGADEPSRLIVIGRVANAIESFDDWCLPAMPPPTKIKVSTGTEEYVYLKQEVNIKFDPLYESKAEIINTGVNYRFELLFYGPSEGEEVHLTVGVNGNENLEPTRKTKVIVSGGG